MVKLPKELTTVSPLSKILAAILFIVLPLVGFFLGMQYQEMMGLANRQQMEANLAIPRAPTPIPDETANWKTYTSRQLGYEIKYPLTWQIIATGPLSEAVRIESKERRDNKKDEPKYSLEISQRLKLSPFFKSYEEVVNASGRTFSETGDRIVEKRSNMNLSVYYHVTSNLGSKTIIIPIPNTKEDYLALRMQTWPDGEPTTVFDQILSTFKFTQ